MIRSPPEASVSFIFNRVQVWLKERGFEVIWQDKDLYFNKPPESALHSIQVDSAFLAGGWLRLSLQDWQPKFKASSDHELMAKCTSDIWTQAYTGDPKTTSDLILFALETKLGRPLLVEKRLADLKAEAEAERAKAALEVESRAVQTRAVEASRSLLQEENAKLRLKLAEYAGTLVPDPWAELDRLGRQNDAAIRLPLYSTLLIEKNSEISYGDWHLFNVPMGVGGQGFHQMSRAETNLKEAGRVPNRLAVNVTTLMIELWGEPEDVAALREFGVLSWVFTQTQLEIAPLSIIIPPGQTSGAIRLADGKEPIGLPSEAIFTVVLSIGGRKHRIAADVKVRVTLGAAPTSFLKLG